MASSGVLIGKEIKERLAADKVLGQEHFDDKLIITPILDLEGQIKDDECSVDLRLGTTFLVFNKVLLSHTDQNSKEFLLRQSIIRQEVQIGDSLILHPNQFILGESLEWVRMPRDLMAYVTAKSSDARDGIQVESANLIHPRFSGAITFELRNNGEVPVSLYSGLTIAQISFHKLNSKIETVSPISKSNFRFQLYPSLPNKRKKDFDIIEKIKTKYIL